MAGSVAQAQEIADLSKVRVAHVGDHEPVLVFRSWDAAVREVEHAHRVIHRLNAELTQVRSRLTAVEQERDKTTDALLKLRNESHAIESLSYDGIKEFRGR